ncbi:dihydrofolate reductase family protein [Hymenobacter canadensis]|uniref:Dihydrofolate reductase family protein n=1 Tax=Hymenobacter canadensis TaxID=2999067 RepID=A0ABY7LN73_9BACT|nr:dihydrofolate reductase family protein [Hymenobacter canadensis]WBA41279.1 dihydrofolate reductase family protein [Hymenobacter canadensis]
MRKVVLYIATSLDGYIASPDGSVEWLPTPPPGEDYGYADFLATADATLLGRATYEQVLMLGEWPYPTLTNYVFSRKPSTESPEPSVQFVSTDPVAFVTQLRQQPGGTIWLIGGSTLALLAAGLVDELMLFVVPRLIGAGIPLWRLQDRPQPLQLLHTQTWPDGMTLLHYRLADVLKTVN